MSENEDLNLMCPPRSEMKVEAPQATKVKACFPPISNRSKPDHDFDEVAQLKANFGGKHDFSQTEA